MELIRILEALERYTEDTVAYKLDATFAHAVSEAAAILVAQGETIADLEAEAKKREETVISLRKKWQEAETLICSMCGHWNHKQDGNVLYGNMDCGEIVGYLCCQKFSPWIPVSERVPETVPCNAGTEYSEAVIVWTSGSKAMVAVWNGHKFLCAASYWEAWDEEITHWAPLPRPLPALTKEE